MPQRSGRGETIRSLFEAIVNMVHVPSHRLFLSSIFRRRSSSAGSGVTNGHPTALEKLIVEGSRANGNRPDGPEQDLTRPGQPFPHDRLDAWCKPASIEYVTDLANRLGLGGVGMNRTGDLA